MSWHVCLGNDNESDSQSDSNNIRNLPILSKRHLSLSPLSKVFSLYIFIIMKFNALFV